MSRVGHYITPSGFGNLMWIWLILTIASCHPTHHLTSADYQRYEIGQDSLRTPVGQEIRQLIDPYKSQLDEEMNVVIGTVPHALKKARIESTLGNWVADAIDQYVESATGREVDLAICNYGGIRIPEMSPGPLTVGKIYELMPFDNYVVTMELSGDILISLLERIAAYGGWPVSASLRMEVRDDKVTKALIHGQPVDPHGTYFVALSDYLANGGDKLDFLTELPFDNLNVYYRDALIQSAKDQKEISAEIEGRIKYTSHR